LALQALALTRNMAEQCELCGEAQPTQVDDDLAQLQSQLAEKLAAQREIDGALRRAEMRSTELANVIGGLSIKLAGLRRIEADDADGGPHEDSDDREEEDVPALRRRLRKAERVEREFQDQVDALTARVTRSYGRFLRAASDRTDQLRALYERYATAFLGVPCSLDRVASDERLFAPDRLVPRFNGVTRHAPATCSEAQQFFLDIAFRMATLDLAHAISKSSSTFLCETPENALDMSYLANVAQMFKEFASQDHSIILTANIQRSGLASQLMDDWSAAERDQRVIQLLNLSQLSDVQRSHETDLRRYGKAKRP
jgi:hypothetical protein